MEDMANRSILRGENLDAEVLTIAEDTAERLHATSGMDHEERLREIQAVSSYVWKKKMDLTHASPARVKELQRQFDVLFTFHYGIIAETQDDDF